MDSKAQMTPYRATGIAEGFEEAADEEEIIEAWQYLVDTGIAWQLQGRFGRTASDLIDAGIINAASQQERKPCTTLV